MRITHIGDHIPLLATYFDALADLLFGCIPDLHQISHRRHRRYRHKDLVKGIVKLGSRYYQDLFELRNDFNPWVISYFLKAIK